MFWPFRERFRPYREKSIGFQCIGNGVNGLCIMGTLVVFILLSLSERHNVSNRCENLSKIKQKKKMLESFSFNFRMLSGCLYYLTLKKLRQARYAMGNLFDVTDLKLVTLFNNQYEFWSSYLARILEIKKYIGSKRNNGSGKLVKELSS